MGLHALTQYRMKGGKAAVKRKKTALLALAALFALLLCGCLAQPMEELYALPRQSDDYNNLQQEYSNLTLNII